MEMMKKENDFLRAEVGKERREGDMARRQIEVLGAKHELVMREMIRRIEYLQSESLTLSASTSCAEEGSSVAKVLCFD